MEEIDLDSLPEIGGTDDGDVDLDSLPEITDDPRPLESADGGDGKVLQMSRQKPGPRALSATAGHEEKIEQVSPNVFLKGDTLFDSEDRTVKPGQLVTLSRKDGTSQLLSFNGSNKNGKPVFEDVRGVSGPAADIAGRIEIGEDDFDAMLAGGKAKLSRSPLEQVRLGLVADTGDEEKYAPGFVGTARAVADRVMPYVGRNSRDLSIEQLKHLANIHEGKLDGYAGKDDDERLGVAAADAGLDYIRPGETREAYSMRIRAEAEEMLKKRSMAREQARAELGKTEASVFDKIVKGGVESGGYALEFALPGGVFGKAGKVLGMGRKALRVVSALGSAVPVVAAESRSRYIENTTPEYGVDEHGELELSAAPDSEGEAAYKAIGGAVLDTAVEIGLESATMGLLRLVGKPAGMALGKMTPSAVKDLGERTFNRFMASETGAALRSINRARQDFTSLTQINSPFGELMEENVQAFGKVLNLDGKTSEYKGFEKELKDYWDRQADWDTQWDIFYGLVAQLAIGAAKSTSEGLANRVATADARRDVRMALARSGISEEAVNSLTTKQQKVLTEMWRRYSADPDALKDRARNLGVSMRAAVDELVSREGIDMARSLEQRGIAPEKFEVQTGVDGKPAFRRMNRFSSDGKSVPMNAMVDEGHGVTIVDQGDGTFYVMNDQRGFTPLTADGFAAAKQLADNEVMDNQRRDADNEKKARYLANLAQGMYAGRNIKVVPTEAALRWGLASAFKNGETPFGLVDAAQVFDADGRLKQQGAGGFHAPDGTVVVILDNVESPSEMERVLAHEATGHEGVESNTGRGENTVEFIRNAKAEGFERYKAGERARYVSALVKSGMDENAANAVADEAMSTDSYQKEAMARYAQGRLHRPTWYERKKHEANEKRRADGESVPFDQADMEVMLAKAEEEGRSPGGKLDIGNADSGVRYFETEQEAADETGNVRDEAQAQPEQGSAGPEGGEAARPVEAQPQGGEAPQHGTVEAAKTGVGLSSTPGARKSAENRPPTASAETDPNKETPVAPSAPDPVLERPAESTAGEMVELSSFRGYRIKGRSSVYGENAHKLRKEDLDELERRVRAFIKIDGARRVSAADTWNNAKERDYYKAELALSEFEDAHPGTVSLDMISNGPQRQTTQGIKSAIEWLDGKVREDEEKNDGRTSENDVSASEIDRDAEPDYMSRMKKWLSDSRKRRAEFERRLNRAKSEEVKSQADTTKTEADGIRGTGENVPEVGKEAPTAMKTEHDFLRVMHDNQKPVRIPVGEISIPDTQFKEGADPKTGVVKGQELKGEYFESAENAVVVYVRKDGTKELVTGRHRFDLAKRNGKNDILARVFREVDGYTPEDMRNLDAISNIIDEKGTEHDYIRYFENARPSRAAAEAAGFLSRSKGRLAFELYEGATEDTRAAIDWSGSGADGLISPEQAGIIAKAAPRHGHPRNGAVQRILVRKAQDGLRGDRLAIVARSLAEEAKSRKAHAADGVTQLDLFTSEEDLDLLALEEKRAARRVQKANEYGRVAGILQTAMQKGGRLDLNKAYAKELGIRNPNDRKQLADARQKALEKEDYWRNAVRLDEADKAAIDAEINAAADDNAKKLAELKAKREAAKIGKPKVVVSKKETPTPADETKPPAVETKPVEGTQDHAPKAEAVVKTATDMPTSETTALLETEKERYIAFRGAHNDFDKAFREANGDLSASGVQPFVEELKAVIAASPTKELQRRDNSLKRIDTGREDDSYHHVRQMIAEELKRRENGPVSAPKEAEAITPPKSAKPSEGRKSGDTSASNGSVTPQQADAQVAKHKTPSIRMKDDAAERKAKAALDAIDFDTTELGVREKQTVENGIDFDTHEFDPERFGKLVTGVGKLVDVLVESGHKDFKSLATYIYEQDAVKYGRAKPVLQDIWNAVARARGLSRVGDADAERVYGTIEAQGKEADNGGELRSGGSSRVDSDEGTGRGGDNGLRPDAAEPAASEGEKQPGGVLADGPVREQNPDGRVDGQRSGNVPGLGDGVAEGEASERGEDAGGEAAGGTVSVGDTAGSALGESRDGANSVGNGHTPGVSRVRKSADKAADSTKPNPSRRDFVMTKAVEDAILEKNSAQRVRNNIDAIKLVRELKARDYAATPGEQATLAKFVGWGGLREKVFGYTLERAYDLERTGERDRAMSILRRDGISQSAYELHKELRQVLNEKEYESAKKSSSTAFYTPIEFVRVLHETLRSLGVKGGRFLGPSAGTGNFASAAGAYEKPVNWQFVENDAMTGELLKALFPNQRVTIGGFEDTKFPDGFFDFAIDNVPYANVPINDRSLSSRMFKIHDYFFAKTLSKLRPGGVMAFLTSTGTLDKTSPILRQFLTEHGGKIVGAVRLPNGFFSENAGTDVASDLVIVQKVQGRPDNSAFEKGVEYGFTTEWVSRKGQVKKPITYNGYFKDHPEQIVGTMEVASGQHGPTLQFKMPEGDMWDQVRAAVQNAFEGIDKDSLLKSAAVAERQDHAPVYDEEGLRQGNVTMKDGKPFIKSGEMLEPIALPNDRKLANELKKRGRTPSVIMDGLLDLRKAMRDVIDAQMADNDMVETDLAPLLAKLNEVYDAFVKKNGTLHDKWVSPFALLDKADGNRLLALERVVKDENGNPKVVKSDIFTKRVISRGQRATKADTPKDALVISYSESGAINVPRIAELLGVGEEEAVKKLKEGGDAFENPQTGRLEPSWEYLSGRVRAKLAAARAAVEAGEESYRANVEALEKVQPPMVRLEDAEIKFGATWVDPECMKDFLRDAFGAESMRISLGKNEVTGQWNVEFGRVMNEDPWGETSWSPQEFVSRVLNHGSMNHYDTDPVDKKRYLNERKTEANKLAAEKLHSAFSQFIQSSDKWASPMYERYNAVMTDMVEIRLPNNVLPFRSAGMSEATLGKLFEGGDPNKPKKGREYQSAVIARGVLGGGSICLAHCVGAGKTLEMQSIGVLGRHLGLFKKPMYVVPNHMLEQFTNEFVEAFPNANILKMSEADVKPENRRAFFAQVANGDWDAIVVKHSTFSMKLPMSDRHQKEFLEARIRDLDETIAAMREAGDKISVDQANKKKQKLQAKLEKLMNAENHDSQIVPFEELGVDQLFVDEAHNFKGMEIETRQGRTGGLSQGDSQRAVDMQMKTQYVQSLHGGDRGVVFATGTPLSNAPVVEAYVMLKYLAPNKLEEQGLKHFDDFVDAFGRITTESEFSTDGKTVKEKDKVSAFVNIPELMKLMRSAVDIVNSDQLDIPRPKPKYRMIDVDMSPAQEQIMEMVARESAIPPTKEQRNKYLTLTRIAKNACLTPRLLGFEDGGNKIIRAVSEIKKVYDETAEERGAQLVFTDIFNESEKTREMVDAYMAASDDKTRSVFDSLARRGGRSGAYNLNEEIRDLLVAAGIPKDEIAIVQDIDKSKGDKDANKGALFAKVRSGEVRVLIGSRPKMGEGTNVQERLAAIHLLHPGWKPSEDEQAIGRIIRPGNTYKEGQIFYYLTRGNANIGSYETKNHQLIGVKSKLIDQVMHGDETVRTVEMDESAMDRDMLMGLASGNKALMELIDVKKRVHKLELNTESTLASARRNKDKAEANSRILERRREEFAREQEGVKEWREKNEGKPFTLSTPDGRSIEKVKDMAEYVSGEMARLLTKDRYDRAERTVLGDFNGVELVLAFDRYGDEKFRLAVPLLGVSREINYSGFVPDFTTSAMTAFKGRIIESVSPDYAKAYENSLADMDRQAKKMSADADRLQKDYEQMRGELIKLRTRQAQLEREVTPLVVQAVAARKVAAYGNWLIAKPVGGQYVARRESDAKSLSAPTVKELIPLMDANDFASPGNAATKTIDLRPHLKPNSKGEYPHVDTLSAGQVDFDTPGLYTGSAADYENPSLHYVGSGEGSQVYGWGLYASNVRGVAESYAFSESSKANPDRALKLNGREIDWMYWEKNVKEDDYSSYKSIANLLAANGGNVDKVISDLELLIKNGWISRESVDWLKSNKSNVSYSGKSGNLYEQTFFTNRAPGDESHLLSWYEPVSEENLGRILEGLKKEGISDRFKDMYWLRYKGMSSYLESNDIKGALLDNGSTGDAVYQQLTSIIGSPKEASEFLARADIDGVKYPVDSYGKQVKDGEEAGWNYVSFRDDNIRVDHKWVNGEIQFDTPELTAAEQAYVEADDKTPTEQVMREVYGMTNDEIAIALRAAAMEPPKHVRKPDETTWKQAEMLLSKPSYMEKLSRAVAKFPRNIADYENNALNVLFRQRQAAVNAAQSVVDGLKETLDAINAIPKGERDADFNEEQRKAASEYAEAKSKLAQAKALMNETGLALTRSSSEAGRRLRSNRGLIDQTDLSYAGISGRIAADLGGADKITPEMDAKIREIAGEFASLDEEGRDLATALLKAHAEKIVDQIKRGDKVRKSTERKQGDEAKRVMRNYNDALAQIEVGAAEVGGTLVGLSDQQYPAWGKWLRAIGEFHCFENPDITEEECVLAIVEDISPFMDGVDENQVRDALTGFGHNFRQSRYDAQRMMNDLRSQARLKRQMDWMDETNTMPPLTGMVRDEPSDTTRNLQKQVQDRKKEVPDAGRDERRLKGVLESAKTRVKNRIADLERAIETGERIPGRDRTVTEDVELRELKKRKDELQKVYDELFKTERGLTDEQRVKLAERLLGRELEHALADLDRARSGDFSKRPKRPRVESPTIDALRDRLNEVREQIRELKKAKYEFGMTPEELAAYNARKMANREKVLMRLAERIVNGDLRQKKKPQPPMPPEMQKRYDAMGEQMKKARQKLADMRLEAENATIPSFWRKAGDYLRFVTTAQRALRATMDFSAVLRQSARITLAHPVMGAKAFGKAWNAAHSEANLLEVNDEIMSDPSIQEAVAKYGLHLREVDATSARDVEMFHGMERNKVRILGKEFAITDIPFFGEFMLKSERHYITYLNAVSAELYSSIVNDRTRFPAGPTAWQKKMVADMINVWNGSAALSKERRQALQKALLNDFFWAPQLAISRIQSAALYDVWSPLVAKGVENADGGYDAVSAEERNTMFRIGASEHFKSSLAMIALGALLKWLFADEDDWYDFGQADWFEKLLMLASPKIGNTTIDLTGGEQSVNRAAHKIWKLWTSGKVRTGSGRMAEMGSYGGPTVWGVIGRYVQGKTSPSVSELVSLIEGRDYVGNEYTWKDSVVGAVVPLTFEDVKDQLVQNGIGKSLITIPLSLLGAGGSTYDRKVYENAVNRFLESKKEYDAIEQDSLLDEANRKMLLDSIVSENPLMRDEVREDIAADIAQIRRDEARARKDEKDGNEPDADMLSEIETGKAKLIEKIRAARRR